MSRLAIDADISRALAHLLQNFTAVPPSRELQLVRVKLEEARFWLGRAHTDDFYSRKAEGT